MQEQEVFRKQLAGAERKSCVRFWCGGCCGCFSQVSFPHITKNGKKHRKLLRNGVRERNKCSRQSGNTQPGLAFCKYTVMGPLEEAYVQFLC